MQPSKGDADFNVAKAAKLAKFYSKDMTVDDFSKETLHKTRVGKELFGTVSSLNLLIQKGYFPSNMYCFENFYYNTSISC